MRRSFRASKFRLLGLKSWKPNWQRFEAGVIAAAGV
jgi:hypothetical protein